MAGDASFDVFPRVSTRGIGGVVLGILGEHLIVPCRGFHGVLFLADLIPQLLDEEEFFGR